jgi:hypothetical protein
VSDLINSVIEQRFVSQEDREEALSQLDDSAYDDVRDLALFHLLPTVPFGVLKREMTGKHHANVVLLLKKVEELSGSQIAEFLRLAFAVVSENDIVLAHFLTQPHRDRAILDAAALLNVDEVDALLGFIARMLKSRRYWRELSASFGALDAAVRWGAILIKANFAALCLQHREEGLRALRMELSEEVERIEAAGACWAIMENIREDKNEAIPPSFMYIVDRINIHLGE